MNRVISCLFLLLAAACSPLGQVGAAPGFTPGDQTAETAAMYANPTVEMASLSASDQSSLWTAGEAALLGDRRAARRGDILTVVIEIDDQAQFDNQSARARGSDQSMSVPSLFGLTERIEAEGLTLDPGYQTTSASSFNGNGSVSRAEKLTLRVAATVVQELPNGVVRIEGRQEVRVNFELRELLITGYIRPADISRRNEITYDKIAGAQISYGGRGQITEVQQPRYGDQIAEKILPF
ncbi:MAG: flagellar basal body L-ring protein FlgH [Paracoccaceae bacterium]